MKKFISMVMAAAMVVSLVPATAFAANAATFKVVDSYEITAKEAETATKLSVEGAQLQLKLKDVDSTVGVKDTFEIELTFDGAEFENQFNGVAKVGAYRGEDAQTSLLSTVEVTEDGVVGDDSVKFEITENDKDLRDGDIIIVNLDDLKMTKDRKGHKATVEVSGDFGVSEDLTFAEIVDEGIKVTVKKTVDIATEEVATLKDIVIEPTAGDDFRASFDQGDKLTLRLNKGFEFTKTGTLYYADGDGKTNKPNGNTDPLEITDDDELTIKMNEWEIKASKITLKGVEIEATSAKEGAVATITAKSNKVDSVKAEVAKVVDSKVVMSVDEEEDVPVYYSGTDVDNTGLTVDDDHEALEVTLEETFAGAWSMNKEFKLELPEGVYVTAVETGSDGDLTVSDSTSDLDKAFEDAYKEGDHESFVFERRTFKETNPDDADADDPIEITFTLTLVADPDFEGDVKLKLTGDAVDEQEVTIAKFVKPYTVKAEQNDLKIDYRYTAIPTNIVITEAEAGLWDDDDAAVFTLELDKNDIMDFEDDATFTVDEKSGLEIDDDTEKGALIFEVTECSDDDPATVTISDMALFMNRNIPAGPYDLLISTTMDQNYVKQPLFAPDDASCDRGDDHDNDDECIVDDVCDFSDVAKEAFVNVVTAGREDDDASFTTKVVVPVGEKYIVAGEKQIALDVPAYINAAGYTMLPVRAVATALGIKNDNVLWNQETRTVTILYGQRIITMSAGEKVVYVNGSAIPAAAKVEIKDNRTFLPMRDLATALGVTDITWDAATKTATLNGNQK